MGHTNKHIILDHLAQSKGLRRKDLVTFICKLNGYDGHRQGYYGTTIQGWAYDGYIVKKGNKWYIGNLGKLYLKHPKQATLKASVNMLRQQADGWKSAYYEAKSDADNYRMEYKGVRENLADAMELLEERGNELMEAMEPKRNTLTLQPPPSTDYSEFTKAELVSMTKHLLHLLSEQ